ncbi:MAG TPA: hypothetical protein VN840_20105 [Streptosporangiaceae bacterium]|nr:hypothetical protein [Streptosporangiaceae bacterium]
MSTTPLAAPNRRTASCVWRSTAVAVRSSARRPISAPIGRSRTSLPPGGVVSTVSGAAGAAGSTSGPSAPAVSSVATPYSGAGCRSGAVRWRSSSARYLALASA